MMSPYKHVKNDLCKSFCVNNVCEFDSESKFHQHFINSIFNFSFYPPKKTLPYIKAARKINVGEFDSSTDAEDVEEILEMSNFN